MTSIITLNIFFRSAKRSFLAVCVQLLVASPTLAQTSSASGSFDCQNTWIAGEAEYCASIGSFDGLIRVADLRGISNGLKIFSADEVQILEAGVAATDKLEEIGTASGYNFVGYQYANGVVRPENALQTIYYYQRAAEHGSIQAKASLGYIYQSSHEDIGGRDLAYRYLQEAADGGSTFAKRQFDEFDHFWTLYRRTSPPTSRVDALQEDIEEKKVDSLNRIENLRYFHDFKNQIVPLILDAFPYADSLAKASIARVIMDYKHLSPQDSVRLAEYIIEIEVEEHEDRINRIWETGYLRSVMIDALATAGTNAKSALPTIEPLLQSPDRSTRMRTLHAFAEIEGSESCNRLKGSANDTSYMVRSEVRRLVERLTCDN